MLALGRLHARGLICKGGSRKICDHLCLCAPSILIPVIVLFGDSFTSRHQVTLQPGDGGCAVYFNALVPGKNRQDVPGSISGGPLKPRVPLNPARRTLSPWIHPLHTAGGAPFCHRARIAFAALLTITSSLLEGHFLSRLGPPRYLLT